MASKIKKQVQDELLNVMELLDEGSTKRALLEGLYNKIDTYDNDKDIVNLVWANKDLPLRMFTVDELEMMPGFNNLLVGEPRTGKVDLNKSFGKDWTSNFENIPYNQIALVAEKNGVDPNELMNTMRDEATAQRRKEIAHEGVLGTVMPFVAKRTQEAIERGETPSAGDVTLDLGQTALEATPYGRVAKFINNPVTRTLVGGVISNTAAPLLTEAADAVVYDDTNPRGTFNPMDVTSGALTNAMGANFLRLAGAGLNKLGADKVSKVLMNLGNRESRKDAARTIEQMMAEQGALSEIAKTFWDVEKNTFKPEFSKLPNELKAKVLAYMDNADNNAIREVILDKLHKANPVTKGQKLAYKDYKPEFLDEEIRYMTKDPVLSKYLSGDYNFYGLPSELQLSGEEAAKNLLTNKLGSYQQEQGKALTRIPFGLGKALQNYIDEQAADEEERKLIDELYTRYKFDILGGN